MALPLGAKIAAQLAANPDTGKKVAAGCGGGCLMLLLIPVIILGSITSFLFGSDDQPILLDQYFDPRDTRVYQQIQPIYIGFYNELQQRLDEKAAAIRNEHTSITTDPETGEEISAECDVTVTTTMTQPSWPLVLAYITTKDQGDLTNLFYSVSWNDLMEFFATINPITVSQEGNYYIVSSQVMEDNDVMELYFPESEEQSLFQACMASYNDFFASNVYLSYNYSSTSAEVGEYRKRIIEVAQSAVGRINYVWGGSASGPGIENVRNGLDCSHFVCWVFWTATGDNLGNGNTQSMDAGVQISEAELQPGDLAFKRQPGSYTSHTDANHVLIYAGTNASGQKMFYDARSTKQGVVYKTYGNANYYYRPYVLIDKGEDGALIADGDWVSLGTFKITAYCSCSKCNGIWTGQPGASGRPLTANRTVAVYKKQIALGTKLRIEGLDYIYQADDYGDKHIIDNCLDLYLPIHEETTKWGVQYRQVWMMGGG